MFKKSKLELLVDVTNAAHGRIYNHRHMLQDAINSSTMNVSSNIANHVSAMITSAIEDAFRVLIDNIYTDEEFEQDIGLKSNDL